MSQSDCGRADRARCTRAARLADGIASIRRAISLSPGGQGGCCRTLAPGVQPFITTGVSTARPRSRWLRRIATARCSAHQLYTTVLGAERPSRPASAFRTAVVRTRRAPAKANRPLARDSNWRRAEPKRAGEAVHAASLRRAGGAPTATTPMRVPRPRRRWEHARDASPPGAARGRLPARPRPARCRTDGGSRTRAGLRRRQQQRLEDAVSVAAFRAKMSRWSTPARRARPGQASADDVASHLAPRDATRPAGRGSLPGVGRADRGPDR